MYKIKYTNYLVYLTFVAISGKRKIKLFYKSQRSIK